MFEEEIVFEEEDAANAQLLLDRFGYLVIGSWESEEVGSLVTLRMADAPLDATAKIIAKAAESDFREQAAFIGISDPDPWDFYYKVITE